MSAIDNLMKRLGLVKLAKYGLVLTPEGRVMSMRPTVLDDGFGGKIVGWEDGDLAAAELETWPAAKQPVARRPIAPPPPMAPPVRAVAPVAMAPAVAAPTPVRPPAPVAPALASAPPEEDDWEWTIAMARARAVAEDTEHALAPPPAPKHLPATTLVSQPAPMPRVARGTPAPFPTHATSRSTVIPVPTLPSVNNARLMPVVRSQKVTRNTVPRTDLDDTATSITLPPPSDDTVPNLVLPQPVRAVTLPSIKRLGRA